jgi:hypothetical protein
MHLDQDKIRTTRSGDVPMPDPQRARLVASIALGKTRLAELLAAADPSQ